MLCSYALHYIAPWTHRSLSKDAPLPRPVQRIGAPYLTPSLVDCTTDTSESNFLAHSRRIAVAGINPDALSFW
jgi:hypothetical protein